ncbi:MAG: ElyC/SanA/YdcF family protein [Parcubacteria group bacterium]
MDAVIILGYGCDPCDANIHGYLNFISSWLYYRMSRLACESTLVIVAGGYTQPKRFPKLSEATMMKVELVGRGVLFRIEKEENSITTVENIRNSIKIAKEWSVNKAVIICDSTRKFKVRVFARKFLKGSHARLEVVGVDFKRSLLTKLAQIPLSFVEILGLWFPLIERTVISAKRKRIKKKDY